MLAAKCNLGLAPTDLKGWLFSLFGGCVDLCANDFPEIPRPGDHPLSAGECFHIWGWAHVTTAPLSRRCLAYQFCFQVGASPEQRRQLWDTLQASLPLSKPQSPHLPDGDPYLYPDETEDVKFSTQKTLQLLLAQAPLGLSFSICKLGKQWPRQSSFWLESSRPH